MTLITVGPDQAIKTLAGAMAAVKPGDTVEFMTGVYPGQLKILVDDTIWRSMEGHEGVLDGLYSKEKAYKSGSSWRDLVYRTPANNNNVVTVNANGVTIDNLVVRNSPGAGIGAGAVADLIISNCTIYHTYETSIVVNGTGGTATNILIDHNTCDWASVKGYDPKRAAGAQAAQNVSGTIKVGSATGVVIRDNTVSRGSGEGINIGKDVKAGLVVRNIVYDCSHLLIYANRDSDVVIRDNFLFFTDDPAAMGTDNESACCLGLRDEETVKGVWPKSRNVRFSGNVCVCGAGGYPFLLNSDGGSDFTIEGNIFIGSPTGRKGITVVGQQPGIFRDNIIYSYPDVPQTTGDPGGLLCSGNRWNYPPPNAWQGEGDVYGPINLKAPEVMPTAEHEPFGFGRGYTADITNYLMAEIVEPPVDPPVEPPVEPPPDYAELDLLAADVTAAMDEAQRILQKLRRRLARAELVE